jgi:hypothetical protein
MIGASGFHPTKTIRVGSSLRTYFVRPSDGKLVFATSSDGKDLSSAITLTNLQRGTTQGDLLTGMEHPVLIQRTDGKYLLVYDYQYDLTSSFARKLIARVSDDGVTWGPAIAMPNMNQDKSPGAGTVFQSVSGLIKMTDGSIRAYFTAGGRAVGSMRTTDGGASWVEDNGYRLDAGENSGYIDVDAIIDTDGAFLLYVGYVKDFNCVTGAGTSTGCVPIRAARSTDGLNFTFYTGNMLTPGSGPVQLADPDVFIAADGKWRMLFGEVTSSGAKLRVAERQ